jgi:hypothetical protein
MTILASYLYGVVPAAQARTFGPIGLDGGEVCTVCEGGLGVVTSPSPRVAFAEVPPERTLHCLAQHQRVLEQVMRDSPVLPLKFGTFAADDRQVREILQGGRKDFAAALAQYAEVVEVDVSAVWADLQTVLTEIAGDETIVAMKARIAGQGAPGLDQKIQLGQAVRMLLDRRRERLAGELEGILKDRWPRMIVNTVQDDSVILNAAVLVRREDQSRFDRALEDMNRRYSDRLNFRCVGPLPPYSFATAEVRTLATDALDAARRSLGLGESASFSEIKAAYRHILQESHPDKDASGEAADRLQDATAAYELLEEYALNVRHTFAAGDRSPVLVRVRSLEDLRGGPRATRRLDRTRQGNRPGTEAA